MILRLSISKRIPEREASNNRKCLLKQTLASFSIVAHDEDQPWASIAWGP